MNKTDELQATFYQECEDLLESLVDGLTALIAGDCSAENVNSIFRAVHSIKGGASAFGMVEVVRFSHCLENTLDAARDETLAITAATLNILMRAADHLASLIETTRDAKPANTSTSNDLIAELDTLVRANRNQSDDHISFVPIAVALPELNDFSECDTTYRIRFRPFAGLYTSGNETCFLLRDLRALGDAQVSCDLSNVPDLQALDPNESYLIWDIVLVTDASELAIREVFEFIDGLCELDIETIARASTKPADLSSEPIVSPTIEAPANKGISVPASKTITSATISELAEPVANTTAVASTIRVELHRIDRLVNLVGELVINQAMLNQSAMRAGLSRNCDVEADLEELSTLTRDIQDGVMAIRAQPIKPLFQRMSRIAREAGNEIGKTVQIFTQGSSTEIDKTVVEKLSDPLTHMVRNAIDHGIEDEATRTAAGKNVTGTVTLSAKHQAGRVVIELSDDGAGIDRERVQKMAIEKNLITPDTQLSVTEIDNLIFMPGFSTASELSHFSGRGVGMDVVKSAIETLGGRISITSQKGIGSTFSVILPLTLAVLDGMIIEVANQTMVVPLSAILETMRVDPKEVFQLGADASVIRIRGSYIPTIDVGHLLGFRQKIRTSNASVLLLVEVADGTRAALLIDEIIDQRQVVIKGLKENYGDVDGVAAATILGDGRIALIIDIPSLVGEAIALKPDASVLTAAE